MNYRVKTLSLMVVLTGSITMLGCTGEEIGRLQINHISTEGDMVVKETTLNLKKGDEVAIWSDMDIEYEGDVDLRFRIEFLKNGLPMDQLEVDPTDKNITLGEVRTSLMDKTDWSFSGKNAEITIDEDATYTFKAFLIASENPSLVLNKAEVVLKK